MSDELKNHTFDRSRFVELPAAFNPCADLMALLEQAAEWMSTSAALLSAYTNPSDTLARKTVASGKELLRAIYAATGKGE